MLCDDLRGGMRGGEEGPRGGGYVCVYIYVCVCGYIYKCGHVCV